MRKVILLFFMTSFILCSQNKKLVKAERIKNPPKIDGILNEVFWKDIEPAKEFIMIEPYNGKVERITEKTEVLIAYDDNAIYFGVKLYDQNAHLILEEFGSRDNKNKNTDIFEIWLNPFNDGINQFNFGVTAAGVQFDGIFNGQNLDMNWDAVWESEIQKNTTGWFIEMKIPYSAIRFPKKNIQEWGLNMVRGIRRYREFYSWNYVDIEQEIRSNQDGRLIGINNISPPIRLSLNPYTSFYLEHYEKNTETYLNGGLDLKYGISENFTLDMTLIPDFGQTRSDDYVLNTSPFEVRYNENRPFFTEGVELFNKAGLFYSRRIGQVPSTADFLNENEEIINTPSSIGILNATKISGRNKNGLAVGLFNAITNKTYITIQNEESSREELLQPLTNYNLFVLDQTFNNNSSVTFTNTNVNRFEKNYKKSNVSSLLLKVVDKKNQYEFGSKINLSQIEENSEKEIGFNSSLSFRKIDGRFRFYLGNNIESDTYDHNDMGFLYDNNEISNFFSLSYLTFQPTDLIIKSDYKIDINHEMLYKPIEYKEIAIKGEAQVVWRNHLFTGLNLRYNFEEHDYNEARIENQVFIRPPKINSSLYTSSDYRKRFALDTRIGIKYTEENKNNKLYLRISPRFRLNDHLSFIYIYVQENEKNQFGYISEENQNTFFSKRDQLTFTNKLIIDYAINKKIFTNIILRHYWARVENKDFYTLNQDGTLASTNKIIADSDINFNSWNIDFTFSYEFLPGSFLSFVWKNQLLSETHELEDSFYNNIMNTFESPMLNSFSLKATYYLDYNNLKKKK